MPNIWFTADFRFGHSNIIRYCNRRFKASRKWIERSSTVSTTPLRPMTSSISISSGIFASGARRKRWSTASRFAARRFLGAGESRQTNSQADREFSWLSNLAEISIHGQPIVICHYAMRVWNRSHHGAWHLYGHSHGNLPDTPSLSMDVGVDTHDFRPWHFDKISTLMAERVKRRAAPEHPSQSSIHD
jgi:calcineurin-like phosphoesterase family protein